MKQGLWRDGDYLVVRFRHAVFPDRCLICNAGAEPPALRFRVRKEFSKVMIVIVTFLA